MRVKCLMAERKQVLGRLQPAEGTFCDVHNVRSSPSIIMSISWSIVALMMEKSHSPALSVPIRQLIPPI